MTTDGNVRTVLKLHLYPNGPYICVQSGYHTLKTTSTTMHILDHYGQRRSTATGGGVPVPLALPKAHSKDLLLPKEWRECEVGVPPIAQPQAGAATVAGAETTRDSTDAAVWTRLFAV